MEPIQEVLFLRKLQRLLDEQEFVATYKFALLQALADLSVEEKTSGDGPLRLSLHRIAEKFVEYYWRQVVPFRDAFDTGTGGLLSHSAGKQAAIVKHLVDIRNRMRSLRSSGLRGWGASSAHRVGRIPEAVEFSPQDPSDRPRRLDLPRSGV